MCRASQGYAIHVKPCRHALATIGLYHLHYIPVHTCIYFVVLFQLIHVHVYTCMYKFMNSHVYNGQADSRNSTGSVCLDINLLKPSKIEFVQEPAPSLTQPDGLASYPSWLEYIYRTAHPVLRWLPTNLAEWIGENLQEELGFPDKADKRAESGSGWTLAELNSILQDHVVDGALTTFGCVEWESEALSCSEE